MFRRIEADEQHLERPQLGTLATRGAQRIPSARLESESEAELLPQGHPHWVCDGVSISQRARETLAKLVPTAIRVLRFWDHAVRSILVAGHRVYIDASGSYRVN
jgi:hypothetical protein